MPCGLCSFPPWWMMTGTIPSPVWALVGVLSILFGWFLPRPRVVSSHARADQSPAEDSRVFSADFQSVLSCGSVPFSVLPRALTAFLDLRPFLPNLGRPAGSPRFPPCITSRKLQAVCRAIVGSRLLLIISE